MHLPMLESGLIACLVKKDKLVTMYHCDINLSQSLIDKMITKIMDISHTIALRRSKVVDVTSLDYALHSRIAYKVESKLFDISAPIKPYHAIDIIKDENIKG